MKKIVVLSGSGMSAPSGVDTFRTPGGLWSRYRVEEVATPQAFARDPAKVLDFYNQRRAQLARVIAESADTGLPALARRLEWESEPFDLE